MDGFKDGLYEKVISQRLGQRLQEALDQKKIWATISDKVDPQEAVGYLSDYIRKLVHLCLKDLADQNGESLLQQELALTNGLIRCLSEKLPALGTDNQVNREDFLLLELQHRINQIQEVHRPRPATSFILSSQVYNILISHIDLAIIHLTVRSNNKIGWHLGSL